MNFEAQAFLNFVIESASPRVIHPQLGNNYAKDTNADALSPVFLIS